MAGDLLGVLGVAVPWVCALWSPSTRNWRFLLVLAGITVLVGGAEVPSGNPRIVALAVLAAVALGVFFFAGRLGLGSFTLADRDADAVVERLERALDNPAGPSGALVILPAPNSGAFARPADPWANVAHLYLKGSISPIRGRWRR